MPTMSIVDALAKDLLASGYSKEHVAAWMVGVYDGLIFAIHHEAMARDEMALIPEELEQRGIQAWNKVIHDHGS